MFANCCLGEGAGILGFRRTDVQKRPAYGYLLGCGTLQSIFGFAPT